MKVMLSFKNSETVFRVLKERGSEMLKMIISSRFIIACSALCLSYETILLSDLKGTELPVFGFVFFGALAVYNLAFLGPAPFQLPVLQNKKGTFMAFLFSGCLSIGFVVFLPRYSILLSGIASLFAFAYLYKIRCNRLVLQIRNVPLLKNVILAFIWAIITVLIPLSACRSDFNFGNADLLIFFRRFFFILAIAIPYDIKDFYEDSQNKLWTLPVKLGIGKSKLIALVSLSCFAFLVIFNNSFIGTTLFNLNPLNVALYISSVITACVILFTNTTRKKHYYSVFIDGSMILQFILVVLSLKLSGIKI